MQIAILRHGATEFNEQRKYMGSTDTALSIEGERQALELGVHPEVSKVYVSPMSRARRTAELCFPNAEQEIVDGLREMDFGDFEGRSAADMENDEAYRSWVESMCTAQCPHGESRKDFVERTRSAIESIVRGAVANGEQNVIVVGHGGTVMASMHGFLNDNRDYFDWHVGNCEGYRAQVFITNRGLGFREEKHFGSLSFMDEEDLWRALPKWKNPSSFFSNRECVYFPCHQGVPEDEFNCMYCYCPLYALGPDCGGNFTYTESGRKSCINCTLPHVRDNGGKIVAARYHLLAELARRDNRE